MGDLVLSIADWIKEKKFYPTVRLLLNLIFTIGVANYFCHNYNLGPTDVLPPDRDNYLDWLISGQFFLPVIIVVFSWVVTEKVAGGIFDLSRWLISRYCSKRIAEWKATRNHVDTGLAIIRKLVWRFKKMSVTKNEMTAYYLEVRETIPNEELKVFHKELVAQMAEIRCNFIGIVRLLLAIGIYWHTIPEFTSTWYWMLTVIGVIVLINMLIASTLIRILPVIAVKIEMVAVDYMKGLLPRGNKAD